MSTNAETPTQNPAQPLFIECNGSPILDQDELPIQIKDPPISDEDEDHSMRNEIESNCGNGSTTDSVDEDDESYINDDLYLGETNYRSLSVVNDGSPSSRVNSDSLMNEVSNSSITDIVKEEPMETVPTVLVPVRDPITREIKSMYVPVEVKDETGLNIIKSVLIPIKDEDGSMSYEIKKVVVPIKPQLSLPQKPAKSLPVKDKDKPARGKRNNKKVKQKENEKKRAQGKEKTTDEGNSDGQKGQVEGQVNATATTDASKEEVDDILENLRTVCPFCQKKFKIEKQMRKHIFRDHKKPFRCKKCHDSFGSQNALEEHQTTHEKDTYVECPFCHQKYKRMSGLRAHQIRVHSSVDPKTIRDRNDESYMTNSDPDEPKPHPLWMKTYVCQYCEKTYPQKSYLVAHKRIAHGIQKREPKTFQCNVCNKNFATESNLRSHASLHSQSFLCSHCGKELANKYSLQLHTRKHTGERPYQCKVCSKSFASSVALRVHRITHTGERPYECDLCGQRFTQRSSMMSHRRKHPGNHPPPPPVYLGSLDSDGD
ncbi:uncharacterized protein LOC143150514 [Ptiloglossa arizonensis]|uniref:uncharacterized protein LOC143150514 n=1 Tax=Ptiloglossa arizonensis TaxID=3350558 RepID=UPI003FA141B5